MQNRLLLSDIVRRGHWVFDLDGTLTVAIHDFASIRSALGVPHGCDILAHLDSLQETEGALLKGRLQEMENELAGKTAPAEGALGLVELLSRRGARLGVLTRNTRHNALRTLDRIGLTPFFADSDVFGRDDALAKPDPDGIFKLAAGWRTQPSEVVMVGDYLFDLQTGRAAGAATVHVDGSRAFRWPELTDLAVGTLAELALAVNQGHLREESQARVSSSWSTICTISE